MKIFISTLLVLCGWVHNAQAHELESNRATLVLRDAQHVSLTFFVDYPAVLHQVLAPNRSAQDNWSWPMAAAVQSQLQQRAMQSVVAASEHSHVVPTEIRAEATSNHPADFTSVTLRPAAQFKQVLVVSYRPKQVWLKPHAVSPAISF